MTNREFFTNIVNGTINDEIKAFAADAITKLDKRNAARASKPTKSQQANAPLMAEMCEYLKGKKEVLASEIAVHLDITTQKASSLLKLLADSEKVVVTEIKVPKVGKRKAYSLAPEVED